MKYFAVHSNIQNCNPLKIPDSSITSRSCTSCSILLVTNTILPCLSQRMALIPTLCWLKHIASSTFSFRVHEGVGFQKHNFLIPEFDIIGHSFLLVGTCVQVSKILSIAWHVYHLLCVAIDILCVAIFQLFIFLSSKKMDYCSKKNQGRQIMKSILHHTFCVTNCALNLKFSSLA